MHPSAVLLDAREGAGARPSTPGGARSERARHVLDAVDERGREPIGRPGDLQVRESAEELLKHHRDLAPSEVRAEAEVRAAAEAEGVVRIAANVEAEGFGEDGFVAVGRAVEEQHLVALADLLAADLGVTD